MKRRLSLGTLGESKFGQKFAKSNVSVCQKVSISSTGKGQAVRSGGDRSKRRVHVPSKGSAAAQF